MSIEGDGWDFCEEMSCLRLFAHDGCDGECPRRDIRHGIHIFALQPDGTPLYAGSMSKKPRKLQ